MDHKSTYTFKAHGHINIQSKHKNTLEFTKDKELSLDGDCIVGIDADFKPAELKKLAKNHKMLCMKISVGGYSDAVEFNANKEFSSERELVLRFSEFSSERTLGFRASKAAGQLDKNLVEKLKDPSNVINITIEPLKKAIIFDFDDTLGDFMPAREAAHKKIAQVMFEKHGILEPTTMKLMDEIDMDFSSKGKAGLPLVYDRHEWFRIFFKSVGVEATENMVESAVKLYWDAATQHAKPLPHASEVLENLGKNYLLAVMTDSDGSRSVKDARVNATGLKKHFDVFVTSDEIGQNKPNEKFYSKILGLLGVAPLECVMVGDKPQVDLELAKKLGMSTVWMKHGRWSQREGEHHFDYVDFEITDLSQLVDIVKQI